MRRALSGADNWITCVNVVTQIYDIYSSFESIDYRKALRVTAISEYKSREGVQAN